MSAGLRKKRNRRMKIKITRLSPEVKLPTRAHYNDAGLDCYCQEDVVLPALSERGYVDPFGGIRGFGRPHASVGGTPVMVPLGFSLDVPDGYMAIIKPRSSFNKMGIWTGIGTCDSGYHGEYKAVFVNLTENDILLKKGDRICQIVIEPVILADLVENLGDEREAGGFGSSGK